MDLKKYGTLDFLRNLFDLFIEIKIVQLGSLGFEVLYFEIHEILIQ